MARNRKTKGAPAPTLVPVEFTKQYRGYSIGETAGFTEDVVKRMVEAKIAKRVPKAEVEAYLKKRNWSQDGKTHPMPGPPSASKAETAKKVEKKD